MDPALDIAAFLARSRQVPMIDVRTPAEFAKGHLPGAYNLPVFSDEERVEIGTLYKQQGREVALRRGLEVVGPKLRAMVEAAHAMVTGSDILVYCWRGGMRSESVAWLLAFAGYQVVTLQGGYKAFRRFALARLSQPQTVRLLGGLTGAGKTDVLHALAARGEQVIDLETLACHKGSVFGNLGQRVQPSQEHFENLLAMRWHALDPTRPVWLEDESRRIGRVLLPEALWHQMQHADLFLIEAPFEARVARLVADYGRYEAPALLKAVNVISKRLGGLRTQQTQSAIDQGNLHEACRLLLTYYDNAYRHTLTQRNTRKVHVCRATTPSSAEALADHLANISVCV